MYLVQSKKYSDEGNCEIHNFNINTRYHIIAFFVSTCYKQYSFCLVISFQEFSTFLRQGKSRPGFLFACWKRYKRFCPMIHYRSTSNLFLHIFWKYYASCRFTQFSSIQIMKRFEVQECCYYWYITQIIDKSIFVRVLFGLSRSNTNP